jgi:hypothetical protein
MRASQRNFLSLVFLLFQDHEGRLISAFSLSEKSAAARQQQAVSASPSSNNNQLDMIVSSPTPKKSSTIPSTPAPKYPTARGSEVDARKIIATGAGRQYLTAIRLAHILFASRELAEASLHELRSASISFEDLARQISNCAETRYKGGALGWISISDKNEKSEDPDEHLDLIFPKEAREQTIQITTKPGDVVLVESPIGFHLVQVADVMADVRKMALRKQRKSKLKIQNDNNDLLEGKTKEEQEQSTKTYLMETMGCQMNQADSERMEGQLQSLGLKPFNPENKTQKPDVVVLNTCSIRDHAEQKVYSYIGPHAKRKNNGEDVTIIVAGCVAQQEVSLNSGHFWLPRSFRVGIFSIPPKKALIVGVLL